MHIVSNTYRRIALFKKANKIEKKWTEKLKILCFVVL